MSDKKDKPEKPTSNCINCNRVYKGLVEYYQCGECAVKYGSLEDQVKRMKRQEER